MFVSVKCKICKICKTRHLHKRIKVVSNENSHVYMYMYISGQ